MKIKIWSGVLVLLLLFTGLFGCNSGDDAPADSQNGGATSEAESTDEATTTEAILQKDPNLRVLSFNVRMDLFLDGQTTLSGAGRNRIQAVREQILSYSPDLIGLQEDVTRWVNNIKIPTDSYTVYRPELVSPKDTQEYCSIYVKNGITVKANGYKWLTSDGTANTVALTAAELKDGDGKYDMSSADIVKLGITNDASLKGAYAGDSTVSRQGNMLAARLMNYVVVEIDGQDVIYVNTHFQHRGYDKGEYSDHPLYMLRYYERCAQFDMVNAQIEVLKQTYKDASVVITGDFNDTSKSGFYNDVCESYIDTLKVAKNGNRVDDSWNSAYDNGKQGQGYTATDKTNSRIDFCIASSDLADRVHRYQPGSYKWTLKMSDATHAENVQVYPSDHLPIIVDFVIGD